MTRLGVIRHAPWCVELADPGGIVIGCEGDMCWQASEHHMFVLTGLERQKTKNGTREYAEMRLMPTRKLADRHEGLAESDTHIIQVTIEPEGWLMDNWVGMTLQQAKAVRAALDDCIRLVEFDALRLEVQ